MATRKVTLSMDDFSLELARTAADRAGLSISAWLSAAARSEAVRQCSGDSWGDVEAQAAEDDDDWQAVEQAMTQQRRDRRAAG